MNKITMNGETISTTLILKKNPPRWEDFFRAEDEIRTRDPNLGKVVLYQLSYFRMFLF